MDLQCLFFLSFRGKTSDCCLQQGAYIHFEENLAIGMTTVDLQLSAFVTEMGAAWDCPSLTSSKNVHALWFIRNSL